jgi:hypothetical protein
MRLLYRWLFRWGVFAPWDRSRYSAGADYWHAVRASRQRFGYLWFFTRETLLAPLRYAKRRLEFARMGGPESRADTTNIG